MSASGVEGKHSRKFWPGDKFWAVGSKSFSCMDPLKGSKVLLDRLCLLCFQPPTSKFTSWRTASAWPRRRPSQSGSLWILFTTRSWSFLKVHRGKWCR